MEKVRPREKVRKAQSSHPVVQNPKAHNAWVWAKAEVRRQEINLRSYLLSSQVCIRRKLESGGISESRTM